MKAMKQQKDWELQGKLMQYEDMRTYAGGLFRDGEELKRRTEEALHTLSNERDSKARLQIQYNALTESFQALSTKYTETTEILSMTQRTNSDLVQTIEDLRGDIEGQEKVIADLREKERELGEEQERGMLLREKIKALEIQIQGVEDASVSRGGREFMNRGI